MILFVLLCVKLGLSHGGRNIGCGCSTVCCWGRYLAPRCRK